MSRGITRLGFMALALAAGSVVAYGQSSTTGSLNGIVTDDKGNPLAGAIVKITSAQVSRTETAGPNGAFRFGLLNPGSWKVVVTKSGFQTSSRDLVVMTNTAHQANVKLAPITGVTVEVMATQVAAVDLTTTQTGGTYTMENLSALPMGRDMNTVANFTPGVADSGFGGMGASMSGASAAENSYLLDGLSTTDSRRGGIGSNLVTDFIDQVEVQTGGFKPEFSALGGVFNAVTKSGTNTFKGTTWATFDARGLQARKKENLIARQAQPDSRWDIGAEVSGPIIADKLFYFVGAALDLRTADGALNNTGLKDDDRTTNSYQSVFKLQWYVNKDLALTLSGNYNPYDQKQPISYAQYGDSNRGMKLDGFQFGINLHMDWTISPSLMLSAKLGSFNAQDNQTPSSLTDTFISDRLWYYPSTTTLLMGLNTNDGTTYTANPTANATLYSLATGYARGGFGSYVSLDEVKNTQIKADLSWFVGNHAIKFGVSHITGSYTEVAPQTGGNGTWVLGRSSSLGGFYARRTLYTQDATVDATYSAAYLQDTWEMVPGLKVAFGARFESQEQKGADGGEFMKFGFGDGIQPRFGVIWDPNNDGKTKVSLNYARYFEQIPQRMAMRQRGNEVFLRTWYRLNAYSRTGVGTLGAVLQEVDYATPFSAIPIMDNTKLPQRDEWIIGVDHTLANGWLVGMHAKQRIMTNPIEDFSPWIYDASSDYGGDYVDWGIDYWGQAILGNPVNGPISWNTKPNSMSNTTPGQSQKMSWISTYPNPKNVFQSVDFTAEKKTDRHYVSFSYTWSRLEGNYEGLISSSNGQADANITASWDYPIYVGYGFLPLDRTHAVKLQGSHNWDLGPGRFTVGASWSYSAGSPISQLTSVEDRTPGSIGAAWNGEGVGIGTWTLPGDQIPVLDYGHYGDQIPADFRYGQFGRTPALHNVDLRLEYDMKIGKIHLIPSVDIFNVFNTRLATSVDQAYTDSSGVVTNRWGMEDGWQIGRRYRFGVKVRF